MQYFKVAAHGLIKKDGKFLVTKRPPDDDYMPNYWDIPGGTIDFGETIIGALNREIKEETNLTVKIGKIILAHGYLSNPERHQFQLVYECDYIEGDIKLDPHEHDEFKWITVEEMKDLNKIAFLEALYEEILNKNK